MRSNEEIEKAIETLNDRLEPSKGMGMKCALARIEELSKILALEWVLEKLDSM